MLTFIFRDAGFHILITNYQMLVSDEKHLRSIKWQYMVLDEAQAIKSSQRYGTLSSMLLFIKISIDIHKKRNNILKLKLMFTCLHHMFIMVLSR